MDVLLLDIENDEGPIFAGRLNLHFVFSAGMLFLFQSSCSFLVRDFVNLCLQHRVPFLSRLKSLTKIPFTWWSIFIIGF
jgi:hypothetical protein